MHNCRWTRRHADFDEPFGAQEDIQGQSSYQAVMLSNLSSSELISVHAEVVMVATSEVDVTYKYVLDSL
jgi:hypothetical protein